MAFPRTEEEVSVENNSPGDSLLQPVGEYVMRTYNRGLVRNTSVFLVRLPNGENDNYVFKESIDGKREVIVNKTRVNPKAFRMPNCATGHSSRG